MENDIVARLRSVLHNDRSVELMNREAADEIERLRELSGDAGKLREERDEARQEICLLRASSTNATEKVSAEMEEYARSRGWENLFGEDAP